VAWLLAGLVGKLFHLLLPFLGTKNPMWIWVLSPILGFIVISIIFSVIAFNVHRKIETFYRYQASELRLALFERLNTRLGICLGIINGALYFVLISFFVFNIAYVTSQVTPSSKPAPAMVRMMNALGQDMQAAKFACTAESVGTLQPMFYKYADLAGFLEQNPQTTPRVADYPGLTGLWQRDDMQILVGDNALTNALASGASVNDILADQQVQDFLKNKDMTKRVNDLFVANIDDLMDYLKTGKSAKYDDQKVLGTWQCNVGVSLAWLRQSNPRMQAAEMRAYKALWTSAYAQTSFLVTGDNQVFLWNWPKFQTQVQPGQPMFTPENWKGDWSADGTNYTLHLSLNGQDKFYTAFTTPDGLRMSVKDTRSMMIFDRAN
jgi:hypothetical protein